MKNPIATIYYAITDLFLNKARKENNRCPTGKIICYTALFGKGKTLSLTHYVILLYSMYNDKPVWDIERKKFVMQKVEVLSNVDIAIPYVKFESLQQIISRAESNALKDQYNNTLTVTLILGDEFSVQMNSRNFKTNIDPLFLNTLLTCRHYHMLFAIDSQRFGLIDALLRQVTTIVIECEKSWRFMKQYYYDAWEMENAQNPRLIVPIKKSGWFISNTDYSNYNTFACVENLKKDVQEGNMLSSAEILQNQGNVATDINAVSKPSRLFKKNKRTSKF